MDQKAQSLVSAFLKLIAAERVKRGMTHEELALRAGIDRSHVGLLEKGLRKPSMEVALSLAWALDIPLAEILAEAESDTPVSRTAPVLVPSRWIPRRPEEETVRKTELLSALTGLKGTVLLSAIEKTYATFDLIDEQLLRAKSPQLAQTVELANLSSMLG